MAGVVGQVPWEKISWDEICVQGMLISGTAATRDWGSRTGQRVELQLQQRSQLILWGAVKLGQCFRDVLNRDKGGCAFVATQQPVKGYRLHQGRGIMLGDTAALGQGQFLGGLSCGSSCCSMVLNGVFGQCIPAAVTVAGSLSIAVSPALRTASELLTGWVDEWINECTNEGMSSFPERSACTDRR